MAATFPKSRTAFVVIHGIGEQVPFETLDGFSRGLNRCLEEQGGRFTPSHRLAFRQGTDSRPWTESFLRLQPSGSDNFIDIHEVYWAYLTEEQITVPEVWAWVEKTLEGTKTFYEENQTLVKRYEQEGKRRFKLERVAKELRSLARCYPLLKMAYAVLSWLRPFQVGWLISAADWLEGKVHPYIVGYIGDVAIYTTTDQKSKFFSRRQQILDTAKSLLKEILADEQYDRVVLCGHSLGSVIAYDVLNRLQIEASVAGRESSHIAKLAGLLTFGSPLDKIAFFFRSHADKDRWMMRAILNQLHSFKARSLDLQPLPKEVVDPVQQVLGALPWVNYYDANDPVSGHLDFYDIPESDNIELRLPGPWGAAHVQYWADQTMYADIVKRFLQEREEKGESKSRSEASTSGVFAS